MLALVLKFLELMCKEFGRYLTRKTIHKELGSSFFKHIKTLEEIFFPERPGQPECHHYMKTGTCIFGSTCKYDHPQYLSSEYTYVQVYSEPSRSSNSSGEYLSYICLISYIEVIHYHQMKVNPVAYH